MPGLVQQQPQDLPRANLTSIRERLGKKGKFEGAAAELTSLLLLRARCRQLDTAHHTEPLDAEAFEAVKRCATLLRTRYTSPAFWRAGRMLFEAAAAAAQTPVQRDAAAGFLAAADKHLEDADNPAPPAAGSSSFLFEGQMSEGQEGLPRPLGMQDLLGLLISGSTTPAAESEQTDGQQVQEQQPEDRAQALDQLFAQFRDAFGNDNAEGLEEALRASLEEAGPSGPPPASKSAIKALLKEQLTAERLAELGGTDVQCSVCREQLEVGEEVQVMPCHDSHCFHTLCLAPWLAQHSSCPVCRFELMTDDEKYERQKVRDANEAEERRGAANAISHNEFMYT